jgi:ABC-type Fe3+-hydroxamate transport system substrate-binding protein
MFRLLLGLLCGWSALLGAQELRVVSYSPGATQTLIDLKATDKIVGATAWCPLPKDHPASRTCDAFNPDLETLLQLKPTAVILPRLANPLWANRCQQAGLKVLVLSAEDKNSVANDIRAIGTFIQQKESAEQYAQQLEAKPAANRRSLLIIWDGMMAGENSYLEGPITGAKYHSPLANTTWQKLDWEIVARIKPDVFLWIENNRNNSNIIPSESRLAELRKVPAVQNLVSVQNGQVYGTTSGSDWLPGTGLCQAIDKLKEIPTKTHLNP